MLILLIIQATPLILILLIIQATSLILILLIIQATLILVIRPATQFLECTFRHLHTSMFRVSLAVLVVEILMIFTIPLTQP